MEWRQHQQEPLVQRERVRIFMTRIYFFIMTPSHHPPPLSLYGGGLSIAPTDDVKAIEVSQKGWLDKSSNPIMVLINIFISILP